MNETQMRMEQSFERLGALLSSSGFAMRRASDAVAHLGFGVEAALQTDNAVRAAEICDATMSRQRKPSP